MSGDAAELTRDAWGRLERWCQRHHPALLRALRPGASEAELQGLERHIGQPLPPDVRVSLALHDGEEGWRGTLCSDQLLSAERIATEWDMWREAEDYNEEYRDEMSSSPKDAVALDYANLGWIPLAVDGGNNCLGVDLAPGPAGSRGQVINFGRDEKRKCVLAADWAEFLSGYADYLESGAITEIDAARDNWHDRVRQPMGVRHHHDVLREWREQGHWPPRFGAVTRPGEDQLTFWRAWDGGTVVELARMIRDHKQADAFPVLADALEEAGCGDPKLLDLCRHGLPEVDGAWVLRLLLGDRV